MLSILEYPTGSHIPACSIIPLSQIENDTKGKTSNENSSITNNIVSFWWKRKEVLRKKLRIQGNNII